MAKTLRSRLAAVAVIALGAGLLQAAPASADGIVEQPTQGLTGYAAIARVDSPATSVVLASFDTADDGDEVDLDIADTFYIASRINASGKPAGSTIKSSDFTISAGYGVDAAAADNETAANGVTTYAFNAHANNATSGYFKVKFTPDVAGTYTFQVWNDRNADGTYTSAEKSVTLTVTTAGAPTKITMTNIGGSSIKEGANGALVKVNLTDAAGKATVLAEGETIDLATNAGATEEANFFYYDKDGQQDASSDELTLSSTSFTRSGNAFFNVQYDEAKVLVVTATGSGDIASGLSATISITFRTAADVDYDLAGYGDAGVDGFYGTGPIKVSASAGTNTFEVSLDEETDAKIYVNVKVEDKKATITGSDLSAKSNGGNVGSGSYEMTFDKAVTISADEDSATFSITHTAGLAGTGAYEVDDVRVDYEYSAPTAAYMASESTLAVVGGTVSVTVTLLDQFGNALADQALQMAVKTSTNRNYGVDAVTKLTNADGQATFSFKDYSVTKTSFKDVLEFYTAASADALAGAGTGTGNFTITYVSQLSGTLKVDASSALNAIDTTDADYGTEDAASPKVTLTFTALDANSSPIVGLPIAVASTTTGAYVAYGSTTVYTGADGKATASVYSTKTGNATFTGTAALISATATATRAFVNAATDAKKVVVAISGNSVSATVTDNYGNPVKGVTVDFARTGTATMNGGAASASVKTNANGVAEVTVSGTGSVTASLAEADYAQAYWIAGYNGKLATDTANAHAIAGVATGTASVAVTAEIDAVKATVSSLSTTITGIQTAISTLVASTTATLTAMSSQIAKIMKKLGIK